MSDGRIEGVKPVKRKRANGVTEIAYYIRATMEPLGTNFERAKAEMDRRAAEASGVPLLSGLMREYEASPEWKKLADSTKAVERFNMAAIEEEFGDTPLARIEQKGARSMFLEWHADLAEDHPRAADMKLGRLQTILKFGFDREKIDRNPLTTFKRAYHVDRSEVIWLPEHFDALNASSASVPMKFAAFLALHTGQRRGDLIALRWRQYNGTGISLVQSKSKKNGSAGRRVYVPATKALKAALDALRAARTAENGGEDVGELHVLTAARGGPYTANGFRLAWQHAFEAADEEHKKVFGKEAKLAVELDNGKSFRLHFHDIRGTAVTMLAEAGCTVPEIATITGHTLATVNRILERYLNRTKALAESAIAKLELAGHWIMVPDEHLLDGRERKGFLRAAAGILANPNGGAAKAWIAKEQGRARERPVAKGRPPLP